MAKSTFWEVQNYIFAKNCILISFWIFQYLIAFIIPSHFIIVLILLFEYWIFQYLQGVKQFGSRSGPTKCRAWSGSKLFANVISRCQRLLLASKGLNTEQLTNTTVWLKPWLKQFHLAPTFSIWLKCWLQQILSQGKPWITTAADDRVRDIFPNFRKK